MKKLRSHMMRYDAIAVQAEKVTYVVCPRYIDNFQQALSWNRWKKMADNMAANYTQLLFRCCCLHVYIPNI